MTASIPIQAPGVTRTVAPAPAVHWRHRHLLDVDRLSREELELVLDLAAQMRRARTSGALPGGALLREVLAGTTVALAFFEPSTRTRVSFELAAAALGATIVNLDAGQSSATKGESLVDTLRTLERTGARVAVLRHKASGAPYLAARTTGLRILNAGDGPHAHPTQALLDAMTLREALGGSLVGRRLAIIGDVAHSRVARSDVHAFSTLGAHVTVGGPPGFVRGFDRWPGISVAHSLADALRGVDAVMALRVQLERDAGSAISSLAGYAAEWGVSVERLHELAPRALVMHPGPTNEGVEISAELAVDGRSLIGRQVENGVLVRMAMLALTAEADR